MEIDGSLHSITNRSFKVDQNNLIYFSLSKI